MANLSSVITQTVGSSTAGVNLVSAPNSASIWTNSGLANLGTTTTAAELPLGPSVPTATKFSLAAGAASAYCDIDVPSALVGTKLGVGWFARCSSSFTATITIAINSYSSSSNRSSNTGAVAITPVVSTVQASALQFYTNFDTSTNQFLRVTINFTGLAAAWYSIAQFQIGPGFVSQGAAIGEWQSYTPTLTNGGTTSTNSGRWRRVGSDMEIETYQVFTGAGAASTFSISIPSGYTIGTRVSASGTGVSAIGTATWYNGTNFQDMLTYSRGGTSNWIEFSTEGGTGFNGSSLANAHQFGIKVSIPISEWAGSGTLALGQGAQVEYAATSGTWDANSTTTVYGPGGQIFGGTLTGFRTKTVTWQYPIQTDDLIVLETSTDGLTWWPLNNSRVGVGATIIIPSVDSAGVEVSGAFVRNTSSTQTEVGFGRYANMANDDTPVANWPSTGYWRVRKAKASAPVGFGLATATASGLISSEYASAEGDLGAITLGIGTWGTIDSKKYKWVRVGKQVTLTYRLESTTAATGLVEFAFALPSDCPTLASFSTGTGTEWTGFCGAAGSSVSNGGAITTAIANLYNNAGTINVYHTQTSAASKLCWGTITYMTA